ncbi:nuclear transport factor 2 family protein [Desulfocurvibacter africanus]|nr:nuclear transport factor 2 family protein [Desulfocurvibacter africanus]
MNQTPTPVSEYAAIDRTIQHYIDGARTGSGQTMAHAFHADATIFGYIGSDLFAGPIQKLFEWNDANGPSSDLAARITSLDVVGTTAVARLEIENWTGHRFTDFFTLLKVEGDWKITNKVFHLHA